MNKNQDTVETFLYIRTDAEIICAAGRILGTQKLRLTLKEAVDCIRRNWKE